MGRRRWIPKYLTKKYWSKKRCQNQCLQKGISPCVCRPRRRGKYQSLPEQDIAVELYREKDSDLKFDLNIPEYINVSDVYWYLGLQRIISPCSFWVINEHWRTADHLYYNRTMEEHEIAIHNYRELKLYARNTGSEMRIVLQQDVYRNSFIDEPPFTSFWNVHEGMQCPIFGSAAYIKRHKYIQRVYLIVARGHLYRLKDPNKVNELQTMEFEEMNFFSTARKEAFIVPGSLDQDSIKHITSFEDYKLYSSSVRNGTAYGIVLRPISGTSATKEITILCVDENHQRRLLTVMRLAKYGKQIRENYRAFKARQNELNIKPAITNGKTKSSRKKRDDDSVKHAAPQTETLSNHVPMDFTGEEGKIVDDPEEARKIAEGSECGQRSITAPRTSRSIGNAIDEGAHFAKPWYHDNLSREEATEMILQCQLENPDGLFIVRPSRTITGTYVLSYRFQNKIYHVQISSAVDRLTKLTVYSIDGGRRRFLDINKLIEFYENNSCTLSCRLTHYLQKNENFDPNSHENARKYEAVRLHDDENSSKNENGNPLGSTSRTTSPKAGDNQKI